MNILPSLGPFPHFFFQQRYDSTSSQLHLGSLKPYYMLLQSMMRTSCPLVQIEASICQCQPIAFQNDIGFPKLHSGLQGQLITLSYC